jgi:hypothetical protein
MPANAAVPFKEDVLSARPSAASLSQGFFLASDDGALFFSTGTAWLPVEHSRIEADIAAYNRANR